MAKKRFLKLEQKGLKKKRNAERKKEMDEWIAMSWRKRRNRLVIWMKVEEMRKKEKREEVSGLKAALAQLPERIHDVVWWDQQ